jgi:O-antigen ligase
LRLAVLLLLGSVAPLSVAGANLAVGLVLLSSIVIVVWDRSQLRELPPRSVISLLLAYIGIHALATVLASPQPSHWAKWAEEMWIKLLLLAIPVIVGRQPRRAAWALRSLMVVGTVAAVYGLFQHFTGRDLLRGETTFEVGDRHISIGFFSHHLSFAGCLLVVWVVSAAHALRIAPARGRLRFIAWAAALISGLALLFNLARSAQIGAAASAGVLGLDRPRRERWRIVLLLTAAAAMTLGTPEIRGRFLGSLTGQGEETRLNLWQSSLRGIADRPLLGWGVGNFDRMLEVHEVEGFYMVRGHAHNDFLMHAVNAGLLGLIAALALLLQLIRLLWRARAGPFGWIALAAAASLVGLSVGGLFQVYQTDDEVEITLYFLVGCGLAIARHVETPAPRHPACNELA